MTHGRIGDRGIDAEEELGEKGKNQLLLIRDPTKDLK